MKRFLGFLALLVFLMLLALAGAGYYFIAYSPAGDPSTIAAGPHKIIMIPRGTGLQKLSGILNREGLLRYPRLFEYYVRAKRQSQSIQAGEFQLPTNLSLKKLAHELRTAKPVSYKVVIPEGTNIHELSKLLVDKKLIPTNASFIDFVKRSETLAQYALSSTGANSLEGYLFPDTYEFTKLDDVARMVDVMVTSFRKKFLPEWADRARELGFTTHEIVILASVIEKETGAPQERPLISSVFHNRLKKGMKLQSDPTTIYGIANFDGNLKRSHLLEWTPYNTYRIRGLPQGPICNPGTEALRAALFPEKSEALFFVARNDGTHHFSETLQEHNRAVVYYQKMGKTGVLPKHVKWERSSTGSSGAKAR